MDQSRRFNSTSVLAGGIPSHRQKGVVLVLGLILLVVLTIVGFSSMKVSGTQQKTAVNHDNKAISLQAAEFGMSIVSQKIADGCRSAASCGLLVYNPSLSNFNLSAISNSPYGFWALNSDIVDSGSEITVEIIGVAKDSIGGTANAQSVYELAFSGSAPMFVANTYLTIDSVNEMTVNGAIHANTDLTLLATNSTTMNLTQGTYGGTFSCGTTYCTTNSSKFTSAPSITVETASSAVSSSAIALAPCSAALITSNAASNRSIICTGPFTLTSNIDLSAFSNYKVRVNGNLTIERDIAFGVSNVLASTGDITISKTGATTVVGNFVADGFIQFDNKNSSPTSSFTGSMKAGSYINIKISKFTTTPGSSSTGAVRMIRWQQVS